MIQSELIENVSAARAESERLLGDAREARTRHEAALAAITSAEGAFEAAPNDSRWKAVAEARTHADRADLIARHHERKAGEAVASLAAAERARDLAAFNEMVTVVSDAGYTARLAGPVAEYADAYDRLHQAQRRLLGVAIEHNHDCARATALAIAAGVETRSIKSNAVTRDVVHIDGEPARFLEGSKLERALGLASHASHAVLAARGVELGAMGLHCPQPAPVPAAPRERKPVVRCAEAIEESRVSPAVYERGPEYPDTSPAPSAREGN